MSDKTAAIGKGESAGIAEQKVNMGTMKSLLEGIFPQESCDHIVGSVGQHGEEGWFADAEEIARCPIDVIRHRFKFCPECGKENK